MVFDISEIVQKWVNDEIEEYGLYLTANVIMNTESFHAYNPPQAFSPLLVVTYIPPPKSWTLMYFLAEDNNLSSNGLFQESQLRAGVVNNDVNITVFYDGIETEAKYVGLAPEKSDDVVENKGELSTGDPDVLTDFIQWSQSTYQAENYALILYDHSSGVSGFGFDEHPGDDNSDCVTGKSCLTFRELQQALTNIPLLDVIYIDACSSATIEVAYELRDQANYLVASQQIAWGPSSHKSVLLGIDQTTSPIDLATLMAQNYYDIFKGITDTSEEDRPGTISVVNLFEVNNVVNVIDDLATLLEANMQAYEETITSILSDVQHFDSDGDYDIDTDDEFVDLYHFSLLINERINNVAIQNSAQALIATLNEYIIWDRAWNGTFTKPIDPCVLPGKCEWELGNSYGVSVFFPNFSRSFYQDGWLDFAGGTIWDIFPIGNKPNAIFGNTIRWGPMLVEYVRTTNPEQPDDPNAPPLQPPLEYLSYTYLPTIHR